MFGVSSNVKPKGGVDGGGVIISLSHKVEIGYTHFSLMD